MNYINEIFGSKGQIAIICSLIASIIGLIIFPQDIRHRIIMFLHRHRRTLRFTITSTIDNGKFIVLGKKRNEKIIKKYFDKKYEKIYLRITDKRIFAVIKNIILNKEIRRKRILKPTLKKMAEQRSACINAMDSLMLDRSAINDEVYRRKYSYSDLIKAIISYCINDNNEENGIKIKFCYYKTRENELPTDIELDLFFDITFLCKYWTKINNLWFSSRHNMDIYDLDPVDYINYIAPSFYYFISIIRNGEWVYSNLDSRQYRIDHFVLDLSALYHIGKSLKKHKKEYSKPDIDQEIIFMYSKRNMNVQHIVDTLVAVYNAPEAERMVQNLTDKVNMLIKEWEKGSLDKSY